MPELDVYILFDDATGALLGLNLCMFGEEKLLMRGGNPMEYSDLAEKCAAVYAEQLGGIQLLQLENIGMDEALYVWHFELADENDQTVRVNLMFSFPSDTSPYLILEPMGDGYYFDPSQMTDELYPEENLADALGVKGQ